MHLTGPLLSLNEGVNQTRKMLELLKEPCIIFLMLFKNYIGVSFMMTRKAKKLMNAKQNLGKEKQTRIEILRSIAETTGLPKVQVESVFASLTELLHAHIRKRGSGEFTIPMAGIKLRRIKKKATKTRKMVSPLTGQEVEIPGKPPRSAVKITALKPLKEALEV